MPSITPNRIRLTLDQKQKIIEDSKKPGFNKAKLLEQYGIGRSTLNTLIYCYLFLTSILYIKTNREWLT